MNVLGVVPIFTTAGVALLPTIVAAVASMAAIVLKPRELLRLGRRWPVAVSVAAGTVGLGLPAWGLASGMSSRSSALTGPRAASPCDWAKVAEEIIARERSGKAAHFTGSRGSPGCRAGAGA